MNHPFTLKKGDKITTTADFNQIYHCGHKWSSPFMRIYSMQSENLKPSFGIVISKKIKGSVLRNRHKRLIREYFRLHKKQFKPGLKIVAVMTKAIDTITFGRMQAEMEPILRKLVKLS